jgi:hypothetical protein
MNSDMKAARRAYRRKHGIHRPRNVVIGDKRTPMQRLLQDAETGNTGHVEVNYAAQWPTFFKAQRLGYLDANGDLTDAGRAARA